MTMLGSVLAIAGVPLAPNMDPDKGGVWYPWTGAGGWGGKNAPTLAQWNS